MTNLSHKSDMIIFAFQNFSKRNKGNAKTMGSKAAS